MLTNQLGVLKIMMIYAHDRPATPQGTQGNWHLCRKWRIIYYICICIVIGAKRNRDINTLYPKPRVPITTQGKGYFNLISYGKRRLLFFARLRGKK